MVGPNISFSLRRFTPTITNVFTSTTIVMFSGPLHDTTINSQSINCGQRIDSKAPQKKNSGQLIRTLID